MLNELCIAPNINSANFLDFQYGSQIAKLENYLNNSIKPAIALLTEGEEESAFLPFRKALYSMTANFKAGQIVDMGHVNAGAVGITEVVDQLQKKGIFTVIISRSELLPHALLRAYSTTRKPVHLSLAESRLDYEWQRNEEKKNLLDLLIPYYPEILTRLSCLGYQSYFVDERVLNMLRMLHFEAHRLGVLRNNMPEVEPIVRDSDIFGLNLCSLNFTDSPGAVHVNPNGFSAAEACQIARYAAMSDRLSCIGLYGYAPEEDVKGLTALLLAQMFWYIVQGYQQRKNEFPLLPEDLTRYEVHLSTGSVPVAFFKSQRSERWWFYVAPQRNSTSLDPEGLISCSYDDYLKTCSGDIPDRLLLALERE